MCICNLCSDLLSVRRIRLEYVILWSKKSRELKFALCFSAAEVAAVSIVMKPALTAKCRKCQRAQVHLGELLLRLPQT